MPVYIDSDGNFRDVPAEKEGVLLKKYPGSRKATETDVNRDGKTLSQVLSKRNFVEMTPKQLKQRRREEADIQIKEKEAANVARLGRKELSGDEAHGALTQEELEVYNRPSSTKYLEEKFGDTFVGDVLDRTTAGVANLGKNSFDMLEKFLLAPEYIYNTVTKGKWEAPSRGHTVLSGITKDLALQESAYRKKANRYGYVEENNMVRPKGYKDLWKEGNYTGAIGDAFLGASESIPASLTALSTGGLSGLGIIGATAANQKYNDLSESNPEMPELNKAINATITGSFEAISEKLGGLFDANLLKRLYKDAGKEAAQSFLKSTILGTLKESGVEGAEEVSSQIGENITDYVTGKTNEFKPFEGILDSFVYGAAGGTQFAGPVATASVAGKINYRNQINRAIGEAVNPSLDYQFQNADDRKTVTQGFKNATEILNQSLKGSGFTFDGENALNLPKEQQKQLLKEAADSNKLTGGQKRDIFNYIQKGNSYNKFVGEYNSIIEENKRKAADLVNQNLNPSTGTIMTVKLGGSENPVRIVSGKIVPNENGEGIAYENSDREIYVNIDGEIQVIPINMVESLTENIPAEEATARIADRLSAPYAAQADNDGVRDYAEGEYVRIVMPNGEPIFGQISGMDNEGNYTVGIESPNGVQPILIEPRQIVNEDHLRGMSNESVVRYRNKKGKEVTGEIENMTDPSLRAQGFIQIDGEAVPVENILGPVESGKSDTEIESEINELNGAIDSGALDETQTEQAISARDELVSELTKRKGNGDQSGDRSSQTTGNMAGNAESVNKETQQNDTLHPDSGRTVETIIAAAPKQKNGDVDYDLLLEQNPEDFATLYEMEEGREETRNELASISENLSKKIQSEEKKLQNATSINQKKEARKAIAGLTERKKRIDGLVESRYAQPEATAQKKENPDQSRDLTTAGTSPVGASTPLNKEDKTSTPAESDFSSAKVGNKNKSAKKKNINHNKITSKAAPNSKSLSKFDYDTLPLRDKILYKIASGQKFAWNNITGQNGNVVSYGLGNSLLGKASNSDRRAYFNIVASPEKGGVTPEQFAHQLWEESGSESGYDTHDILNEIIDVLQSNRSTKDALQSLESDMGKANNTNEGMDEEAAKAESEYQRQRERDAKLTPTQQQEIEFHISEYDNQTAEAEKELQSARNAQKKKLSEVNNRNGLFGDIKSDPDGIFGDQSDFSEENLQRTMQPLNDRVAKAESDLKALQDGRDSAIEKIKNDVSAQTEIQESEMPIETEETFKKDDTVPFQKAPRHSFRPISKKAFDKLISLLKKTGLAKNVITDTAKMREYLEKHLGKEGADRFMTIFEDGNTESVKNKNRKILRTDDNGRNIVWENENYFISHNLNGRNPYIALWDKSEGKKVGELYASLDNKGVPDGFLSMDNVKIDPKHRGQGLSVEMYQAVIDFSGDGVRGISSYLPDRINKKQVPHIWGKLGGAIEGDFQNIRFMSTPKGEVYGFVTPEGDVYLDPGKMNANTPIHEFGHLWNSFIKENNRELWEKGAELIQNSPYWKQVNDNPAYAGLSEERKIDEALAMAIGDKGEAMMHSGDILGFARVKNWLDNIWQAIKKTLGVSTSKSIESMTLDDFTKHAVGELTGGKDIGDKRDGKDLKDIRAEIARAEAETDTNPTEAQKKAGNYKKGHVTIQGFDISIEQPKGSVRRGVDEKGNEWETKMNNTYGYFGKTESRDGDHIDVFLGNNPLSGKIFVVDQVNPETGVFDEHKVMFGFDGIEQAQDAYLSNYEKGWKGMGSITETNVEAFRRWAVEKEGRRIKPFAEYAEISSSSSSQTRTQSETQYANQSDYDFDVSGVTEANAQEMKRIKTEAQAGGIFMKAPNGKPTKLNERQWLQVRTEGFKEWFGNWQKQAQINKLRESKPIEISDNANEGKYELTRDSAQKWILDNLRGKYRISDTGETIELSKIGAQKVTSHSVGNEAHLKSISSIPQLIENGIFIEELPAEKKDSKYNSYRYYVAGLKIGNEDYTVKITIGVKGDNKYYDHNLTQIEKGKLIDYVNQSTSYGFKPNGAETADRSYSESKDTKLLSILQVNPEEISKVVDENGDPLVVYHYSPNKGFTAFDKTKSKNGYSAFYFSDKPLRVTNEYEESRAFFLNIKEPYQYKGYSIYDTPENDVPAAQVTEERMKSLQGKGFDGGFYVNNKGGNVIEYTAFSPSQIKSATDNNGNFDDKSDDIRFQFIEENSAMLSAPKPVYEDFNGDIIAFAKATNEWNRRHLQNQKRSDNFVPEIINDKGVINYDELNRQTNSVLDGTVGINALSLAEEEGRNAGGRTNVEATLLLRGEIGTDGSQQGNTRERQEKILKEYAQKRGVWISPETIAGWKPISEDVTMEARVYDDGESVIKVGYNYLNFYETPLEWLTDKISLNNYLFPDTALELIGFTETYGATKDVPGTFFAPVYRQRYIKGHVLKDSELPLLKEEMKRLGFTPKGYSTYYNDNYIINDLHVDNVMIDDEGNYLFIDTVPRLNTADRKLGGKREYGDYSPADNSEKDNTVRFQIINDSLDNVAKETSELTNTPPEINPGESILDYAKRVNTWHEANRVEVDAITEKLNKSKIEIATLKAGRTRLYSKLYGLRGTSDNKSQKISNIKEHVSAVKDYINRHLSKEMIGSMGEREFRSLLSDMENATTRRDIDTIFRHIDQTINTIEYRKYNTILKNLLNIKVTGKNEKGVSVAKSIDDDTRKSMEYIRGNRELSIEQIDKKIEDLQIGDEDGNISELSARRISDLELVKKLAEIDILKQNVDEINKELYDLDNESLHDLGLDKRGRILAKEAMQEERINAQRELNEAVKSAAKIFGEFINTGKTALTEWRKSQTDHKLHINRIANAAVANSKGWSQEQQKKEEESRFRWLKDSLRSLKDFALGSLNNFNIMLKLVDTNNLMGEGRLYDYFMRDKTGVMTAGQTYRDGMRSAIEELDASARSHTGKSLRELAGLSRKKAKDKDGEKAIVRYMDKKGGAHEIEMSNGELLYLYAVNKMKDGRIKLDKMGIGELTMNGIAEMIPQDLRNFMDWVQSDFLPGRREKYNRTHKKMFGASMAKIDGYFPLKYYMKEVRGREKDITEEDIETLPSSITGAIINRVRNNNSLDLSANALDVLAGNLNEMEEWNAYAQVRRDINTVINNKFFQNSLEANMKGSYKLFKDAAKVAVRSFKQNTIEAENFIGELNRSFAAAGIGLRVSTALKQFLSYPAFMGYSLNPGYQARLVQNAVPAMWIPNWKWAMENLPTFKDRWDEKNLGDEKLLTKASKLDKNANDLVSMSMFPNRLVDAITVVAGAKSVYDYQYAKNKKAGMAEDKAKRHALVSASIAFNETQQSALDEFLAPMQKSGSAMSRLVSTFMNNNFAFMRKQVEALTEIYRIAYAPTREALLQGTAKRYVKSGLSEDAAVKKARQDLTKAFLNDLNQEVIFGFALGLIWRYGMSAILGTLGDDDDELQKDMMLSAAIAPFDGTVMVGNYLEAKREGYDYSISILDSESRKMIKEVERIIENDDLVSLDAVKITGDILLRFRGLNLSSAYNIYEGIAGLVKDGADANDIMTLLNMPKTEKRAYAGKIKEGESLIDYAKRVGDAYNNEKMFQKYIGQYIDKYYFHDNENDMTEFNRVLEKAKRWAKLKKENPESEEFKELDKNGIEWGNMLKYIGSVRTEGKKIISGKSNADNLSESTPAIKMVKEIVKNHEPEYGD